MEEADILDQVNRLCQGWIRLAAQLQPGDVELQSKAGLKLLPKKLREDFENVTEMVTELQQRAGRRLDRMRG